MSSILTEHDLPHSAVSLVGLRIQPTIGADAASLLDILVRAMRPKRLLEIGTSYGYAACVMGLAAKQYGGHVTTLEIHSALVDAAEKNVQALGLEETVTIILGDAVDIVPSFREDFGLILQDGGKLEYLPLLDSLVKLLTPRGVLITDDILFPVMNLPALVHSWQEAMADYNRALASRADLHTVWLPIGDGIAMSVKV